LREGEQPIETLQLEHGFQAFVIQQAQELQRRSFAPAFNRHALLVHVAAKIGVDNAVSHFLHRRFERNIGNPGPFGQSGEGTCFVEAHAEKVVPSPIIVNPNGGNQPRFSLWLRTPKILKTAGEGA
jgi:hypothetical protein